MLLILNMLLLLYYYFLCWWLRGAITKCESFYFNIPPKADHEHQRTQINETQPSRSGQSENESC